MPMPILMLTLLVLGVGLLLGAPRLARIARRGQDPGGLTRIIQAVAVVILVIALLTMPRSPESTAFPPPAEGPPGIDR